MRAHVHGQAQATLVSARGGQGPRDEEQRRRTGARYLKDIDNELLQLISDST